MIALKFPALQKMAIKDKDIKSSNFIKYVNVVGDTAMVTDRLSVLCINLRDYFTINNDFDEEQLLELDQILNYMDSKSFTPDFWNELTKGSFISLIDNEIVLTNTEYSKALIYNEFNVDFSPLITMLKDKYSTSNPANCISYSSDTIKGIISAVGNHIKNGNFLIEHNGSDGCLKFTFTNARYVYGIIQPRSLDSEEMFKYHEFETFLNSDQTLNYLYQKENK